MKTYQTGSDPRFTFAVTDEDDAAADPTSVKVSIQEPDGTLIVDEVAATPDAGAGNFHYDFTTLGTQVGFYALSVLMTGAGGRTSIEVALFRVVGQFEE